MIRYIISLEVIDFLFIIYIIQRINNQMEVNELFFIGVNKYGQAGIGQKYHNQTFSNPKPYAFPIFIKQIACGSHHSALLTIDGNIYTMGSNIHGALGSNPNLNYSFVPTLVEGLTDVTKIDCGPFHMCAVSNGEIYSWGKGIDGQLGHGNTKNVGKPMKIECLQNVEEVSCGTNHTLVLVNNSQQQEERVCYAFGNGIYGQLGSGQTRNSYNPVKVNLSDIQCVSAGENHSLFLSKGKVYSCGDNSNGQLATNNHKKFISEPVMVELPSDYSYEVKMIQARKFSAALTDRGEIYIWGFKSNVGGPKLIKNQPDCQIIDIRIGNDTIYGLSTKGVLYSWNISKTLEIKGSTITCERQVKLSNGHAILDFSIGDNYMLILGDIIKQVPYSLVVPLTLSCDESEVVETQRQFQSRISGGESDSGNSANSGQLFIQSDFLQEQKDNSFNNIEMDTKLNHLFAASNNQPSSYQQNNQNFSKLKHQSDITQKNININDYKRQLNELKYYNNKNLHEKVQSMMDKNQKMGEKKGNNSICKNKMKSYEASEEIYHQSDTYQMAQTPSSSILGEPNNFFKESISEMQESCSYKKKNINDSVVENEPGFREMSFNNVSIKKKKYTYNYKEDKENLPVPKAINTKQKDNKKKKLDKIIQMLQKSNNLMQNEDMKDKKNDVYFQNQREIIQSNRILRVQLRQKQIKISNLQELLSRKEMQIQAQRQLIKALRDKNNNSGLISVEPS